MKKVLLGILVSLVTSFSAWSMEAFTGEKFKAAQANNELVLVDVKASWCPTCAKQAKLLKAYKKSYPDSKLKVLVVDYDDQKEWVSRFKAPRQSTLILYKGETRVWFSVAETRKKVIFQELQKAEML